MLERLTMFSSGLFCGGVCGKRMSIDTNLKAIKDVLWDPNLHFVCFQLLTFRFDSSVKSFPTEFLHIRLEAVGNQDALYWNVFYGQ